MKLKPELREVHQGNPKDPNSSRNICRVEGDEPLRFPRHRTSLIAITTHNAKVRALTEGVSDFLCPSGGHIPKHCPQRGN